MKRVGDNERCLGVNHRSQLFTREKRLKGSRSHSIYKAIISTYAIWYKRIFMKNRTIKTPPTGPYSPFSSPLLRTLSADFDTAAVHHLSVVWNDEKCFTVLRKCLEWRRRWPLEVTGEQWIGDRMCRPSSCSPPPQTPFALEFGICCAESCLRSPEEHEYPF